jgi:hypothetical protein
MCDAHAKHAVSSVQLKKLNKAGRRNQGRKAYFDGVSRAPASSRPRSSLFVDGRHPDVAFAGAHEEVTRLSRDYRALSGQTLLSLSIGTCQQLVGAISPLHFKFSSERDVLPADRAGHVDMMRAAHTIRSQHLAWVSQAVNQLVAVEYALARQVDASANDIEAHDATSDDVCVDCSFTEAAFAAQPPIVDACAPVRKR